MSDENRSLGSTLRESMIRQNKNSNFLVRCVSAVDIFSFIPVPKSRPVSTRCSLIGSGLIFAIFLSYLVYDLVTFITNNPPIPNSYYIDLDNKNYSSPGLAMVFMQGKELENQIDPEGYFIYKVKENFKKQKSSSDISSSFVPCNRNMTRWLSEETFNNYSPNLVCPSSAVPLFLNGLLYVTDIACNPAIKVSQCYTSGCKSRADINRLQAGGRLFFFVQRPTSSSDKISGRGGYLLYNFFLVQQQYKRINIQLQVNRKITQPNYLSTWKEEIDEKLDIVSVSEMNSNVVPNNISEGSEERALLVSIELSLNPTIKVTTVACLTLIDHIAQWGALWGVLFAIFAVFFLTFNKNKYYKKNPRWDDYELKPEQESRSVILTR